jgi:phage terminase small subunit
MTPKQSRFVEEYLIDLNATQAAIRAGYSAKTAGVNADKLLKNIKIKESIQALRAERSEKTGIESSRVLLEIARLAFNDPRKAFDDNGALLPIQQWPDEVAAAISSIKVFEETNADGEVVGFNKEIKFWDKNKSLDMASRHLGMYDADKSQKPEITLTGFRMVVA